MKSNLITKEEFKIVQERLHHRFGVVADSHFLEIPSVSGGAYILISGEGPPVVMVSGFGDPAMWAPLMAELNKFALYAVDRPCFGLTGFARHTTKTFRTLATRFLAQVLDSLQLERPVFVGNSIGSL
jgi:pimeloyl-ACP methyl ester carboxylesterase